MAVIDLIEKPDMDPTQIVGRVPEHGSGNFVMGSQCVVRESQAAVFFRDGKALDVLGPGRHTLTTANLPILSGLFGIPFGGKSPFTAEVYYVNLREFLDQKWGTPEPIAYRDTDLGIVRLRAFGSYAFQVVNPQLFVNKVVGAQGRYDTQAIGGYLRNLIVSSLIDLLGENLTSILDLPRMYDEIAAGTRAKVQDQFAQLGLDLKAMQVGAITAPEEVQKMMDQRASMGVIGAGNMQAYTQFQAAQALREAANNPSGGGVAGLGVGFGAGAGLGQMMGQAIGNAAQPQPPQQAPPQAPPPQQAPAQPAMSSADRIAALKELASLKEAGVLTDEEFQKEKQRILGQ